MTASGARKSSPRAKSRNPASASATGITRRASPGDRRIARQHRAYALVTGEVVGQVASQTLENLANINDVVSMPVLRPLIGMDKDEIIVEAQRLGTFPVSIIPDQDCCTLFTPRHPATKARRVDVEAAEQALPTDEIVQQAAADAVLETFRFPV